MSYNNEGEGVCNMRATLCPKERLFVKLCEQHKIHVSLLDSTNFFGNFRLAINYEQSSFGETDELCGYPQIVHMKPPSSRYCYHMLENLSIWKKLC